MMSPADRLFWQRAQRRAAGLQPDLQAAVLRAFAIVRDRLSETQLARLIAEGRIEQLMAEAFSEAVMEQAFRPLRDKIRSTISQGIKYTVYDVPKLAAAIPAIKTLTIAFDYLNPAVLTAIRTLETRVITTLEQSIRDTVRAAVEQGLLDGVAPRTIARGLREIIGLAPSQEQYIRNLRAELEAGQYAAAGARKLIDRRFNLEKLASLSPADRAKRIDAIVTAYRKSYTAFNAETNARTATLDALKLGQRFAWQEAIDKGVVDGGRLRRRWTGVMDNRERPEHVAMEGQVVGFDDPFSNGEVTPGESSFNCRCLAVVFQESA